MTRLCRFGLARLETRLEREADALCEHSRRLHDHGVAGTDDLDGVLCAPLAVAPEVTLVLAQRPQPLHGPKGTRRSGRYTLPE